MGFLYRINGPKGELYFKTPKQLCERVIADSESSNYDWIATAEELYRICTKKGFPEEYSRKIKECILNCYGNFEFYKKIASSHTPEDERAVEKIYFYMRNSKDEELIAVAKRYFTDILNGIFIHDKNTKKLKLNYGKDFFDVVDEWKRRMIEEYFCDESINDLNKLRRLLKIEYYNAIQKAKNEWRVEEQQGKKFEGLFNC